MTFTWHGSDLQQGYVDLVGRILETGDEVSPRGQRTLERSPALLWIKDPRRVVPVGVGRKLNLAIGAAESCHLLGGFSDAAQLVSATKNFAQFVEQGKLRGAYGPRTYSQAPLVLDRLASDRDTRQASLVIARPTDLETPTKDLPCTREIAFTVREQRLNMHVTMRSNDVFWGLPYDAWMFSNLQHAIAYCLDLPVGNYFHSAYSLHAYVDRDGDALAALHPYDGVSAPPPMLVDDLPREGEPRVRWRRVLNAARVAAGHAGIGPEACPETWASVRWYRKTLEPHATGGKLCGQCRYVQAHEIYCHGAP